MEPPNVWKRYVDDNFAKMKIDKIDTFLRHLNNQHDRINFTTENMKDGKISFLDTEGSLKNNELEINLFRKKTHTDQYLNFNSNHHISQKLGIISTMRHRINTLITTNEGKMDEERRLKKMMRINNYPKWTLKERKKNEATRNDKPVTTICIPYINNTSEKIAREYKKYNIKTIYKPTTKLKST